MINDLLVKYLQLSTGNANYTEPLGGKCPFCGSGFTLSPNGNIFCRSACKARVALDGPIYEYMFYKVDAYQVYVDCAFKTTTIYNKFVTPRNEVVYIENVSILNCKDEKDIIKFIKLAKAFQ